MGWMSNKYLLELLPHKLGECSMNFQHKCKFYYGMFPGAVCLFLWSEIRHLLPLLEFHSCLQLLPLWICPAHTIRLIFSRATLIKWRPCFKTLSGFLLLPSIVHSPVGIEGPSRFSHSLSFWPHILLYRSTNITIQPHESDFCSTNPLLRKCTFPQLHFLVKRIP